jgi:Cd2+/Zn2+-exporting ATPase
MAAALVDYAQSKSIQPKPEDVTETCIYHGEGIYGEINGKQIYIGNERIMARSSCHQHAGKAGTFFSFVHTFLNNN